ncbi:MAG: MFS transporter [Firmicutes bacterium]|nr:MFS transporter [Bacillota bacterium]
MKTVEPTPKLSHAKMQRAMRVSVVDGMFGTAGENFIGPFLALFALALGATKGQIGLLAALPAFLSNALQIPAAQLADRWGERQRLVVVTSAISRLTILPIALVPILLNGDLAIYVFIALVTLRGLTNSIGVPAWTAIMADITPRHSRGSYFGYRNVMCNLAALVSTLVAGWFINRYGFPLGYKICFYIALGFGLMATYFFSTIPVPKAAPRRSSGRAFDLRAPWQLLMKPSAFRNYCFTSVLWNFAVTFSGSFYAVFYRENLGGDPGFWGVVMAVGLGAGILGHRYWGRLADRYGQKNVMLLGGIGASAVPFMWLVLPRPELAVLAEFGSGFAWSGYNLAAFNLILELTPDDERTTYIGVYNTLAGLATAVGPLMGGFFADAYGLVPVIIISGVLRWVAYFVFMKKVPGQRAKRFQWSDFLPFGQELRLGQKFQALDGTPEDD